MTSALAPMAIVLILSSALNLVACEKPWERVASAVLVAAWTAILIKVLS